MNIQTFGEEELADHLNSGGSIYSHFISIGKGRKNGFLLWN